MDLLTALVTLVQLLALGSAIVFCNGDRQTVRRIPPASRFSQHEKRKRRRRHRDRRRSKSHRSTKSRRSTKRSHRSKRRDDSSESEASTRSRRSRREVEQQPIEREVPRESDDDAEMEAVEECRGPGVAHLERLFERPEIAENQTLQPTENQTDSQPSTSEPKSQRTGRFKVINHGQRLYSRCVPKPKPSPQWSPSTQTWNVTPDPASNCRAEMTPPPPACLGNTAPEGMRQTPEAPLSLYGQWTYGPEPTALGEYQPRYQNPTLTPTAMLPTTSRRREPKMCKDPENHVSYCQCNRPDLQESLKERLRHRDMEQRMDDERHPLTRFEIEEEDKSKKSKSFRVIVRRILGRKKKNRRDSDEDD